MLERIDTEANHTRTIHLTLTRHCNMNCAYCFSETEYTSVPDELTCQDWMAIVDDITEIYGPVSIVVKGGEPMLRKDFFDILKYVKTKGHFITLVTNGVLIKDESTARQLERFVDQMEISLDGVSPETTDPIKGQGRFSQIMAGIEQVKKTRIKLGLSFVILEENKEILNNSLESFLARPGNEGIAMRIDDRISFPVDLRNGRGDLFDFLRNTDKLACHGRLGRNPAATELEVDASGMLHPFSLVSPSDHQTARSL